MKEKNVDQAAFLLRQWRELAALTKAGKVERPSSTGNDRRVCIVEFADASDSGAEPESYVELTPKMGRKLIPLIEEMLRDELQYLGVELRR